MTRCLSFIGILAITFINDCCGQVPAEQLSKQIFNEYRIDYKQPPGFKSNYGITNVFTVNKSRHIFLSASFLTMTSQPDSSVFIYTYIVKAKPDQVLKKIQPDYDPEKNWINIVNEFADTLQGNVTYYDEKEKQFYHADNAGQFDLIPMDAPYNGIYNKARAVFFNRAGDNGVHYDIVIFYFYKEGVDVDKYISSTKGTLTFFPK